MLTAPTSTTTATMWPRLSMAEPDVCAPIDANGNLTSDGSRTFDWDARNQLVAVTVGTHRSEFTYDGSQRRVRVVEKDNSIVQSDTKVVWCRRQICEERTADGVTVVRRSFGHGEQVTGASRYFTIDHLGSVTAVTDGSASVMGRYAFDPWGGRTLTAGTDSTDVGFTGHRWHSTGTAWLAQYRLLDPMTGRWVSEDPLGLSEGPNLYSYVVNRPMVMVDPDGRAGTAAAGVAVGGIVGGPPGAVVGGLIGAGIGWIIGNMIWDWVKPYCETRAKPRFEPDDRCKKVKQACIETCSDTALPTYDHGFAFWNCVNKCMAEAGCY